jgi:hypothetical protein
LGFSQTHQSIKAFVRPRAYLEELSFLEEENRVEMILLDLPELLFEGREVFPGRFGDV